MNLAWSPTKVLITGTSGSGKTLYWTKYLLGSRARWKFVFDHDGQLSARLRCRPARQPDQVAHYASRGFCLYDPSEMWPGRLSDGFDWFCQFVFEACKNVRGSKLFACDELQSFVPSRGWPEPFAAILQTGRVHEIDTAFISVAPNAVHPEIRNQATEVVAFSTVASGAVDFLQTEWGFDGEELRQLPQFRFIARRKAGGTVRGRIKL